MIEGMNELEPMQLYELFSILEMNKICKDEGYEEDFFEGEEDCYREINNYYAQEYGKKLDINSSANRIKLYVWIKEKARYQLLNELIKITIGRLMYKEEIDGDIFDNTDYFAISNMKSLIDIMAKQYGICFNNITLKKAKLTKINSDIVDDYVKKILIEIDPTMEWLKIYIDAKKNNNIIYLDELSEDEKVIVADKFGIDNLDNQNITLSDKDDICILITRTNTISDVSTIIHEFIHYVKRIKNKEGKHQQSLVEFYSIFYELYALNFLKKCGYSIREITTINSNRLENTMRLVGNAINIFHYIEMYLDKSEIKEEYDIDFSKKALNKLNDNKSEILNEAKISANRLCDRCIKQLLLRPFDIYSLYPYVIGNYLAIEAIKRLNTDNDILFKIKNYLENSINIDPYDVFIDVGCNVDKLNLQRVNDDLKQIKVKNYILKPDM